MTRKIGSGRGIYDRRPPMTPEDRHELLYGVATVEVADTIRWLGRLDTGDYSLADLSHGEVEGRLRSLLWAACEINSKAIRLARKIPWARQQQDYQVQEIPGSTSLMASYSAAMADAPE